MCCDDYSGIFHQRAAFGLKELTATEEARIGALVKKAVS